MVHNSFLRILLDDAAMQLKDRQWHFVAFVYDNINKIGTFHVDSVFGYHENGTDIPVSVPHGFHNKNVFRFCLK